MDGFISCISAWRDKFKHALTQMFCMIYARRTSIQDQPCDVVAAAVVRRCTDESAVDGVDRPED